MTHDPERWLKGSGDAESRERDLLLSIRDASPPKGAKDTAWLAIASQIGVAAAALTPQAAAASGSVPSTATQASVGSALHGLSALKLAALVGIGLAGAGGGGAWLWLRQPSPQPAQVAVELSSQVNEIAQEPPVPVVATQPEQPRPIPTANASSVIRSTPKSVADATLALESSRLAEARTALRSGNPALAKRILLRLANELPKAALSQEREVLMIEALMAQGETASAQRRVRAFIAAHPNSPHSAQLTRFLGQK